MATDTPHIYETHIYTPLGRDRRVEIGREIVRSFDKDTSMRQSKSTVRRTGAQLAGKPLPFEPVMVETYDDLFAVIEACATALGAEDEAGKAAETIALQRRRDAELAAAAKGRVAKPTK